MPKEKLRIHAIKVLAQTIDKACSAEDAELGRLITILMGIQFGDKLLEASGKLGNGLQGPTGEEDNGFDPNEPPFLGEPHDRRQ